MPELARFYGIIIKMYLLQAEHPPPHIHAIYGEYMSSINIETGEEIEGDLPGEALRLVLKWVGLHKKELMTIWKKQKFKKLPPLK
ncbi:MAG: DUF4160 domain-containing protein [Fibromonadaceae bacterium]|jgi:hypothetical protein|nr:DUF4160 domain-containing protein [Fibromonadaceae bacterium]